MAHDVAGERGERATRNSDGAIGVTARAAAVDEAERPMQLVEQTVVHAPVRKIVEQPGEPREAVEAGTALASTLPGEVGNDVRGPSKAALASR